MNIYLQITATLLYLGASIILIFGIYQIIKNKQYIKGIAYCVLAIACIIMIIGNAVIDNFYK